MGLNSPSSLAWFALAVPIVVFYILKIRLRRQPVSTIMFWTQVLDEQNPRSIWQRLRHLVSLLLQLAMLSLLTLAATDPYFSWEIRSARRLVLVIDHSASMNATDIAPTRLQAARRLAERLVAGMRHYDEVALIAAGAEPQVIVGFTSRQKTLTRAIQDIPATDGPSHVAEAIALGQRLLGQRQDDKQAEVIVLTDGRFAGAEELLVPGESTASETAVATVMPLEATSPERQVPIRLHLVGKKTANLGITQFQVRRSLTDPLGYEILAEVTNASDQLAECRLEIELNDDVIDVIPLKLDAEGKWSQVFEKTSAEGGHLVARLAQSDSLPADNQAVAVLPRREVQPVLLVTSGNLFLQKVFEVNPLVKLTVVDKAPATIPAGTLVVYHRVTPDTIPPGRAFIIDPANSTDLFTVGEQIGNPIVTRQDKDSPLMSHVRLDNVLMPEARQLTALRDEQTQVLAEVVTKEPIFFAVNRPEGRVLVLTVNLDKGDLPLRTAFPITVANALHWFTGSKGDLREAIATGSLADISRNDFSRSVTEPDLVLRSPQGDTRPLPTSDRMTLGPLDHCGVWSIGEAARSGDSPDASSNNAPGKPAAAIPLMEIACNLASAAESDIRPSDALLTAESNRSEILSGIGSRPVWFWLLLLGLVLTTVEWALYQRRIIS